MIAATVGRINPDGRAGRRLVGRIKISSETGIKNNAYYIFSSVYLTINRLRYSGFGFFQHPKVDAAMVFMIY